MRVFGLRFVDDIKKEEEGTRKKSRLVAKNYNDGGPTRISTKAPTLQRFSQHLLTTLIVSLENMTLFKREVIKVCVQSQTALERPVYIRPPAELNLPAEVVLKVVKPMYGIPESGFHRYLTYLEHHLETL